MTRTAFRTLVLLGSIGLGDGLAGCQRDMTGAMDGMAAPRVDRATLQRQAGEIEQMALQMRPHLERMRRLSPEETRRQMGGHADTTSAMLDLMERHMREMAAAMGTGGGMGMGMGSMMGMDHGRIGEAMGMSPEACARMAPDAQRLRAELAELRTATATQAAERMPAHLDRAEAMLRMLEASAAHMRGT